MSIDWNRELVDQLDWHWQHQLRARLVGLGDDEYFWEPVPGCWNLRPRETSSAPLSVGGGAFAIDYAIPEPTPAPVTTIAWRLAHVVVGVLGMRAAAHFGGAPVAWDTFEYAGTANASLDQLDLMYARWLTGVRSLGAAGLERPCGPAEGPFATYPMAALVLHINREVIHHGAEISLLRDLYRRQSR
jgi:hypothetical protein